MLLFYNTKKVKDNSLSFILPGMVFFDSTELAPVDPILGITLAFANDTRKDKINLGVGTYKTIDLKPYVLTTVKEAEKSLLEQDLSKEYLAIDGDKNFLVQTKGLILGESVEMDSLFITQTVGGTGALRVGADFLKKLGLSNIYISDPTWDNHKRIFTHSGLQVGYYPYYNSEKKSFDFQVMLEFLNKLPEKSVVLLQGCCHNPTGFDPTFNEWKTLAELFKKKKLFPFFDFAYQGFGLGIQEDANAIRHFAKEGLEMLIASSFSKNFGLYAERVGALLAVCKNSVISKNVASQIKVIIRGIYSNPPCHGARVVSIILSSNDLRKSWEAEVSAMRTRISEMRRTFVAELSKNGSTRFSFMQDQKGMFSYTGLEEGQVQKLIDTYGIYMPKDGRINVAGLNPTILPFVAKSILEVT